MNHMSKNRQILLIYLFLILTTLTAFGQVGNHEFVNFDDNVYITDNLHIRNGVSLQGLCWAFTTGHATNWHPLTWISHMLDIQLFGLKAQWHHLTNLLFHIANVLLLFFVLHRMTKALWQSAFVAALFALHPLHVESVAWISERKDVLSTFFWMLTLIAYRCYAESPRLKTYLVVIAFFALGLMAKPMLVTLPFVLLLLDYWPLERFRKRNSAQGVIRTEVLSPVSTRKKKGKTGKQAPRISTEVEKPATPEFQWTLVRPLVLEKIPLFALTILSCAATYIAQKEGGAVAPTEVFTTGVRVANAFISYLTYIAKMIWPDNLAMFYPHPGPSPFWQVLGAVLLLVAVTFAVIRAAKRSPYLPVGWLWFTGTLVPVIGIVQVGSQAMADRYTYIPSIGLFIMTAWGVPVLLKKHRYAKEILAASSALCLLLLFALTLAQVGYWRDSISLFDHTLDVTENNYYIHTSRGGVYNDLGNYTRAIADFDRAIQLNPRFAMAYNYRGYALDSLGYRIKAMEDFDRAIEIDPHYPEAHYNRGVSCQELGKFREAIDDYDKAAANKNFKKAELLSNRGAAYAGLGDQKKAIDDYDKAIEINPEHAKTYFNRGVAYGVLGNIPQALRDFERATEINPEYAGAYYNRGKAHFALGNHTQAMKDIKTAAGLGHEDARKFLNSQGVNW